MRVSAGLPTGMEGLTYPIPFSDPGERDQDRPGGRKVRLPLGVGQRPHDDPELRARRVPGAAALLGTADHLRLRAVRDQDHQGRHRHPGAADASRHRRGGEADLPPSTISATAGWNSASASAPIARNSRRCSPTPGCDRGDIVDEGLQALQPAVQGARRDRSTAVTTSSRTSSSSPSRCRRSCRSMSAATTSTTSRAR